MDNLPLPQSKPGPLLLFELVCVIGPLEPLLYVVEHRFGGLEINLKALRVGPTSPPEVVGCETLDRSSSQLLHPLLHPIAGFVPAARRSRPVQLRRRKNPLAVRLHERAAP